MREIVIISGKGGTGKTSVAAALASVAAKEVLMADCSVDAADLHLILKPSRQKAEDFYSGFKAVIDPAKCINCGRCAQVCRFDAIEPADQTHSVKSLDCEGCAYCAKICPVEAITMEEQMVGELYHSTTAEGIPLVHAKLGIGADNSGKLVARVKKAAGILARDLGKANILVDGSPGIGCPVISSLSGADRVLLVTEPSLSGMHDLKRVWELCRSFNIPGSGIINKADINPGIASQIGQYFLSEGIRLLDSFDYDEDFSRSLSLALSLPVYAPERWNARFERIWESLKTDDDKPDK